jgi:hypothetical protein
LQGDCFLDFEFDREHRQSNPVSYGERPRCTPEEGRGHRRYRIARALLVLHSMDLALGWKFRRGWNIRWGDLRVLLRHIRLADLRVPLHHIRLADLRAPLRRIQSRSEISMSFDSSHTLGRSEGPASSHAIGRSPTSSHTLGRSSPPPSSGTASSGAASHGEDTQGVDEEEESDGEDDMFTEGYKQGSRKGLREWRW